MLSHTKNNVNTLTTVITSKSSILLAPTSAWVALELIVLLSQLSLTMSATNGKLKRVLRLSLTQDHCYSCRLTVSLCYQRAVITLKFVL